MKTEQNHTLKPMLPLLIAIFTIAVILILSFIYEVHKYPLWLKEGGIIETFSAIGYFVAALLILVKGKWSYIQKYHYFFILILMFGLRELDFHKKFTTMGMFKSRFYLSDTVPMSEKLIGLMVILLILYIFIRIIKNHSKGFFKKIKAFSPVHIGGLLTFMILAFSKSIDGLSRKLGQLNIVIEQQTSTNFEVIEEVLELGIPLLIIATLLIYFAQEKNEKHNTFSSHDSLK